MLFLSFLLLLRGTTTREASANATLAQQREQQQAAALALEPLLVTFFLLPHAAGKKKTFSSPLPHQHRHRPLHHPPHPTPHPTNRHLRCAEISSSDLGAATGDPSTAPSSSAAAAVANDNPLVAVRRPPSGGVYRSLSYNPAESAALLTYDDAEGGGYELYPVPRDSGAAGGGGGRGAAASSSDPSPEPRRGAGAGAVFVARNRFAVLDREANLIAIKNLRNETTKAVPSPLAVTDAIFSAGTGRLLLRGSGDNTAAAGGASSSAAAAAPASTSSPGDRVVLFDVQQRAVIAEVSCPGGELVGEGFFLFSFSREFFFPKTKTSKGTHFFPSPSPSSSSFSFSPRKIK